MGITAEDAFEILFGVTFTAWVIVEWLVIWFQRPRAVYDPWEQRWRAQRGMEGRGRNRRSSAQGAEGFRDPDEVWDDPEEGIPPRSVDRMAS